MDIQKKQFSNMYNIEHNDFKTKKNFIKDEFFTSRAMMIQDNECPLLLKYYGIDPNAFKDIVSCNVTRKYMDLMWIHWV